MKRRFNAIDHSNDRAIEMTRRVWIASTLPAPLLAARVPERTVVLTLDDAVKSHCSYVAPLLQKLGFGATFFITHSFMADAANFMSWQEVSELHRMGFEIGNHSWTHSDCSIPRNAGRLAGELALVENALKSVGVPRPVSFAYSGNRFGPEAVTVLRGAGYKYARRGEMPEAPYGKPVVGAVFDPRKQHRLLIPTTGDAYPNWTFEHFRRVISHARENRIVVLQFHGVPDVTHPWVSTPPEMFERYMRHLKTSVEPSDPLLSSRYPSVKGKLQLPVEIESTQADLRFWLPNMLQNHHYTIDEAALVSGLAAGEIARQKPSSESSPARVMPYPGGRPLRVAFREGAIDPMRGTKVSVFLPWEPSSYVVVDLPEAIFSNRGLLFLAHTHVPTIWNDRNIIIENVDWSRTGAGLRSEWKLPNGVIFGATIGAVDDRVEMELWLRNGSPEELTQLRTQICVLLKGAAGFNQTTNANKIYGKNHVTVRDANSGRSIATEWERCGRTWGNTQCPCMHSDPILPDCPPGETVRVRGKLWFG
jgi:peptidoglycan/xylan/chitin deacetylase (PgdA/CDA1 family)